MRIQHGGQWAPAISSAIAVIALACGADLGWWWLGLIALASFRVEMRR